MQTQSSKFSDLKRSTESYLKQTSSNLVGATRSEGRLIGPVVDFLICPKSRSLVGLIFQQKTLGRRLYVTFDLVESIGRDIVFLNEAVHSKACRTPANRVKLSDLQGHWVTSADGIRLGLLTDLGINEKTGVINRLWFGQRMSLPINDINEVSIGKDEIIVADQSFEKLDRKFKIEGHGLSARIHPRFGKYTVLSWINKILKKNLDRVKVHNNQKSKDTNKPPKKSGNKVVGIDKRNKS